MTSYYPEDSTLFLKDANPFEGLGCHAVRRLGELVVQREYAAGDLIFSANEKAEFVYFIREGRVKLYRMTEDGRENVVALLGSGDLFGEFVLGGDLTHSVFAQAFEPSDLCILTRAGLFRLLAADPMIAVTIVNNIGRRLSAQAQSIENLSTYTVDLRFGKLLLSLAGEFGSPDPEDVDSDDMVLTVNLTHQDLANMTAMCRQTVTSIVNRFKRDELLSYRGRTLVVHVSRLKQYLAHNAVGLAEAR